MSSVVSFLNMLERDVSETNGNVRRMLSVCAEFDRIARVVLDKADRDLRSGRGKRKAAGVPMTERDRQKELRDRGEMEKLIAEGLEEGKTLEQIQVETQAAYRRPVETPSLRASIAGSQQGSTGASPASWGGSQPGGVGPEYRSPPQPGLSLEQQAVQNAMGRWGGGGQHDPYGGMLNGVNMDFRPQQPEPAPANFSQPQANLTDGFGNPTATGLSPTNLADPLMTAGDLSSMNGFDPGQGMGATGSFQQPFVPQDLWQMPMTLEWDWAEGLGLGSFTPGPMFDPGFMDGGMDGIGHDRQ